jgi:hypothetical protein
VAVIFAIFGLLHFFVFITSIALFTVFYKKENYGSSELITFISLIFIIGVVGFFTANQVAFISDDPSVLMSIGYSIIPITQASLALLSYSVLYLVNTKTKKPIKFAPICLGIIGSAPVSVLSTTLFSQPYWTFLGKSIYGQ